MVMEEKKGKWWGRENRGNVVELAVEEKGGKTKECCMHGGGSSNGHYIQFNKFLKVVIKKQQ